VGVAWIDLHLHTRHSDGTFTPEQVASHANKAELTAISLTDHDTTEGCAAMAAATDRYGIEFVPGVELTAEMGGQEVHLLGYYINPENEVFLRETAKFQRARQERIIEMCKRLNAQGIPLRPEQVMELARCHSPGRPHVARAMVGLELCGSFDEAFARYLKKGRPAWAPKLKVSAAEAINLIHAAGGLAVMAHPGLTQMDPSIPGLVEAGLDGIECFHTKHTPALERQYKDTAHRHGLLVTGGSDCHGDSKGKPLIGTVLVAYAYLDAMRRRLHSDHPARIQNGKTVLVPSTQTQRG